MTQEQNEALTRRDFGRMTATGLGGFALSDVLFRVFRIGDGTAYAECPECENCCDGTCDGCEPCDGCDVCEGCEDPCETGECAVCDPYGECMACDPEGG